MAPYYSRLRPDFGSEAEVLESTLGSNNGRRRFPVVETHEGLTKRFGKRTVVRDVELQVPRGVAFGYLGPNGAGKTTLIRMLLGLTRPNAGTMSLRGLPVPKRRAEALSRVGAIVEEPRFHGHLTGRENLAIVAAARGRDAFTRIEPAIERVGRSTAPAIASRRTRWGCASGSASRAACSPIPSC